MCGTCHTVHPVRTEPCAAQMRAVHDAWRVRTVGGWGERVSPDAPSAWEESPGGQPSAAAAGLPSYGTKRAAMRVSAIARTR